MVVPKEQVPYPANVEEVGSSSTSSESKNYYHYDLQNEIHATEFPFPPAKKRGVGLRHSRSHLVRQESGRENNDKESRHRRSSSHSRTSSRSISALLILTNERLTLSDARNAALETQKEELLIRFAALVKDKASVEADLRAALESLRLHKVQLELTQKEVNRANEVVRGVDQARVQAENEAARLRSKLRQLEAEKVTRQGWEEGWDIGFQEGMERVQVESGLVDRVMGRHRRSFARRRGRSVDGESEHDQEADDSTISSSVKRAKSPPIRYRKGSIDTGSHVPPLPATSAPIDISITQPQQPVSRVPFANPTRTRAQSITSKLRSRSSSSSRREPAQRPPSHSRTTPPYTKEESRTSSPEVIRPLPVNARPPLSPSMSHRSIPPDNYIPTMTQGGKFIPMPPPHELSAPVPSATPAQSEPATPREDTRSRRDLVRSRAMSDVSRASTRISEYDLVSPPPHDENPDRGSWPFNNKDPDIGGQGREKNRAGSSQMVEEWRNIVTPPPQPGMGKVETVGTSEPPSRMRSPPSKRSRSPRGPRDPRSIAKPIPLSMEAFTAQDNLQTSSGAQQISDRGTQYLLSGYIKQPQQQMYTRSNTNTPPTESTPPAGTARTKTPISWLKKQFQRSWSSPVVPQIEIEPPSETPTSSSSTTRLDPILLSPEDANRPIALPNDIIAEATRGVAILPSSTPLPNAPITITLPDGELPLGFVPMTPVMRSHTRPAGGEYYEDTEPVFSPIPDNYSLPDPFHSGVNSPVQRPATASSTKGEIQGKEVAQSPRSKAMSFNGHWGWASPGSDAALSHLSLFSDR
ncbi:hypothetical protein BDP27DRAFT_1423843 [Rhodocollybia butyracea]|uniref:Uncharacterized protein n=1 Tax=Rhodocollybia butyracea TaxID=206335 RepID=A0A9P5U480_9AGAR|nr:hypothetical protein BDP27DRAFT_1423843 [Rhodocollybia butyracea]